MCVSNFILFVHVLCDKRFFLIHQFHKHLDCPTTAQVISVLIYPLLSVPETRPTLPTVHSILVPVLQTTLLEWPALVQLDSVRVPATRHAVCLAVECLVVVLHATVTHCVIPSMTVVMTSHQHALTVSNNMLALECATLYVCDKLFSVARMCRKVHVHV